MARLDDLWKIAELNWYLGSQPPDFGAWESIEEANIFEIRPPDGSPGLAFPVAKLEELVVTLNLRFMSQTRLLDTNPWEFLRGGLREDLHARYDALLHEPPWNRAAGYGGECFFQLVPEALMSEARAEQLRDSAADCEESGVDFVRVAEWVTSRLTDVRLVRSLLEAFELGAHRWKRRTNRRQVNSQIGKLLAPNSPLSVECRDSLVRERERLQGFWERVPALRVAFERRRKELESSASVAYFGKKARNGLPQSWPYFSHEIVNLVAHFAIARPNSDHPPFRSVGLLLNAIAPDLYGDPDRDRVRKRYHGWKKRVSAEILRKLPEPAWLGGDFVRCIPE